MDTKPAPGRVCSLSGPKSLPEATFCRKGAKLEPQGTPEGLPFSLKNRPFSASVPKGSPRWPGDVKSTLKGAKMTPKWSPNGAQMGKTPVFSSLSAKTPTFTGVLASTGTNEQIWVKPQCFHHFKQKHPLLLGF